jgi:pyrrolysine biosynthesis protein PylC
VGIVGGKLQGIEAAYLARKAGWSVRMVDRLPRVPASVMGDSFAQCDVVLEKDLVGVLGDVDFIIPAFEDDSALRSLARWSRKTATPLAFDPQAYRISSSKLKSTELFKQIGLPIPVAWPHCCCPVLAKPVRGSGSKGIHLLEDMDSLKKQFPSGSPPADWILEEFLDGSQHSLEVAGQPGNYRVLQVTDLYVDQKFDCKRVIAPSRLAPDQIAEFEKIALTIAEAINLHGIMDVEAIYARKEFKILEIDARLPSQTPTAVYWSTNQNMVVLLGNLYVPSQNDSSPARDSVRGVVYEHIQVCGNRLKFCGERVMSHGGPLRLQPNFFGADEAITNFASGIDKWVATLVFSGANKNRAWEKRNRSIDQITRHLGINEVVDSQPALVSSNSGSRC